MQSGGSHPLQPFISKEFFPKLEELSPLLRILQQQLEEELLAFRISEKREQLLTRQETQRLLLASFNGTHRCRLLRGPQQSPTVPRFTTKPSCSTFQR